MWLGLQEFLPAAAGPAEESGYSWAELAQRVGFEVLMCGCGVQVRQGGGGKKCSAGGTEAALPTEQNAGEISDEVSSIRSGLLCRN